MLLSKPKTHPYKTHSPPHCIPAIQHPIPLRKPIQLLEIIPAPADGKSEKHTAHLNSQRRAMRY